MESLMDNGHESSEKNGNYIYLSNVFLNVISLTAKFSKHMMILATFLSRVCVVNTYDLKTSQNSDQV